MYVRTLPRNWGSAKIVLCFLKSWKSLPKVFKKKQTLLHILVKNTNLQLPRKISLELENYTVFMFS